ncbi:MAG: hypothetical protein AAF600_14865 [Bacteroidota bacterium]
MIRNIGVIILLVFISGCGGGYTKNPVDILIRDMTDAKSFSIILYDMDVKGNFSKEYFHQYQIIETMDENPTDSMPGETSEVITEWLQVPRDYFEKNADNMGMEIAAKNDNGQVTKVASPPGYSNYVGNTQYGQWRTHRDGYSFWEFYGQFAFMQSMFNLATYPVRRSYYDDYRGGYYGNRPYYGPKTSGVPTYGTNSKYTSQHRSNSSWSKNPRSNAFTRRVNNSVKRSSSRYSSSSSMRSRSRGVGK